MVRSFPLGRTGEMRRRWSIGTGGRSLARCAGTARYGRSSGWLPSRRCSRSSLTRPASLPAPSGRRSTLGFCFAARSARPAASLWPRSTRTASRGLPDSHSGDRCTCRYARQSPRPWVATLATRSAYYPFAPCRATTTGEPRVGSHNVVTACDRLRSFGGSHGVPNPRQTGLSRRHRPGVAAKEAEKRTDLQLFHE
jgi:hypothetical protein